MPTQTKTEISKQHIQTKCSDLNSDKKTLLQRIREEESNLEGYLTHNSNLVKVQLYPTFVSGQVIVYDGNISKMRFELKTAFSKLPYLGSVTSEFNSRYIGFEEAILNVARHVVLPSKTSPEISSEGIYSVECPVRFWFCNNGSGHEVYGSSDLFISHDISGFVVPKENIEYAKIRLEELSELLNEDTNDNLEQKTRDLKLALFYLSDCKKRKSSSGTGLYLIQKLFNSKPSLFEDGTIHINISPVRYNIPVRIDVPKYTE